MKKILFLCDGDNFPEGAFAFIKSLHAQEPVFVKGLFFTTIDFEPLIHVSYIPASGPYVNVQREQRKEVNQSIERFTTLCRDANIKYHIHDTKQEWQKNTFQKETRFADLVVLSEDLFGSNMFYEQPNYYMHEALHEAECPVMLVPEAYKPLERIVAAYDGKKESMFALKQFNYLFPYYADLPAEFIYVKEEAAGDIPELDLFKEYTSRHFDSQNTFRLNVEGSDDFARWMDSRRNTVLVAGSFSRSSFSTLWRRSFADKLINHHIPLFIAHNC